jgi:hypothetical protein
MTLPESMVWITDKIDLKSNYLIYYWSISCGFCKVYFKDLQLWKLRYPDLDILLVHLPTSEYALNVDEVVKVYNEFEMKLPCCLDNNHDLKDIINPNSYTPQIYLYLDGEVAVGGIGDMVIENIDKKILEVFK